ncbi:C39 family peptidase [Paramaledivibacter caminithermalis]|jgi:hypothetical protein|uniref:Peptidase_C39 like family protein n=1 Tax=Paramaledivibacter caminithermalis (strain DSM 15212 / CIP 107654 / DViRD3) TaxID=1121301 RepID=A0A1M6PVM5_PARC5|nr:C39 family peptidase [Paramaledivibacter caminithermalis]SHK11930.1 Peptidase_C39 like family protein [Paramaledivibacter caminithermalis DSM 15212]
MFTGCINDSSVEEIKLEKGTLVHVGEAFRIGIFEGATLNDEKQIILQEDIMKGSYTSPVVKTKLFKELVASWNSITAKNSETELLIKIKKDEKWSQWFSYGKWSLEGERASIKNQRDKIAYMDIDTLVVLDGGYADAFQYKIMLYRNKANIDSPRVKLISTALNLSEKDETTTAFVSDDEWMKEINVPKRAQLNIPDIGRIICSPTSVSMVLEYHGINYDTEKAADLVKDYGAEIYGNWSFNTAFAGSRDLYSYVDRFDTIYKIKDMISKDIPVVASVKTKIKEDLEGTRMPYPDGHLLVVRGFTIKNGEEYVIVNDPATNDENDIRREYKLSQFIKAWRNIVYIITPNLYK